MEFDLHAHCGLDLLDFIAGRYSWDKLLRLLGQLPWWSRYRLAVSDDDEYQARALEQQDESEPQSARPELRGWGPHEDLKATIVDGFNTLSAAQSGKKGRKPKPTPRPETGMDRAKRVRASANVAELFEEFAPGR